jgi:hypothetical protein
MMAKNDVLTDNLAEPLDGVTTAKFDINMGDGNLTIDRLTDDAQLLASGALQYFEKRGQPTQSLVSRNGQATLTLRAGATRQPWFRLPWAACNGATEWQIHLNPTVSSDITAHSDGGNVKLDLTGMAVTRVFADTGGGNVDVVLPSNAANLSVTAKTGAGAVVVCIPSGVAARIRATTGVGKVTIDPRFTKTAENIYESSDFDSAAHKVEMTLKSGAGSVSVNSM